VNQIVRTVLLAAMQTLDDVDITVVQRGNLSHGVAIPRTGGLTGVVGDRGRGGDGLEGGQGGGLAGGRGSVLAGA
jgi:hypothetical protein